MRLHLILWVFHAGTRLLRGGECFLESGGRGKNIARRSDASTQKVLEHFTTHPQPQHVRRSSTVASCLELIFPIDFPQHGSLPRRKVTAVARGLKNVSFARSYRRRSGRWTRAQMTMRRKIVDHPFPRVLVNTSNGAKKNTVQWHD